MTALLEPSELIVRGDFRVHAARDTLEQVRVDGDNLECLAGARASY